MQLGSKKTTYLTIFSSTFFFYKLMSSNLFCLHIWQQNIGRECLHLANLWLRLLFVCPPQGHPAKDSFLWPFLDEFINTSPISLTTPAKDQACLELYTASPCTCSQLSTTGTHKQFSGGMSCGSQQYQWPSSILVDSSLCGRGKTHRHCSVVITPTIWFDPVRCRRGYLCLPKFVCARCNAVDAFCACVCFPFLTKG